MVQANSSRNRGLFFCSPPPAAGICCIKPKYLSLFSVGGVGEKCVGQKFVLFPQLFTSLTFAQGFLRPHVPTQPFFFSFSLWSSCEVFEERTRRCECSLCLWLPGILYSHSCPHLAFRNGLKFLPEFVLLSSLAAGRFSLGHASTPILFLLGSSFSLHISGQLFAQKSYVSDGFKKVLNLLIGICGCFCCNSGSSVLSRFLHFKQKSQISSFF